MPSWMCSVIFLVRVHPEPDNDQARCDTHAMQSDAITLPGAACCQPRLLPCVPAACPLLGHFLAGRRCSINCQHTVPWG